MNHPTTLTAPDPVMRRARRRYEDLKRHHHAGTREEMARWARLSRMHRAYRRRRR